MLVEKFEKFQQIESCPIRNVLDRIGDKWSILVLTALNEYEVLRFNELSSCLVNISQKMLSVTLKALESDGLIGRQVYPQIPPKVEYTLTERGKSLMPHISNLIQWADLNMADIISSRNQGRSS
ncbi:winged helix-turn-helix transcriptional regulator [Sphingobacterium sp. HJSM2_6]|uniref:winged helix-turn-helix transcriptional regulator n=1 Tax=Sphingobacterium sp. HJSM2_6 TaxID=3366264 RepID=UPI003BDF61D0